MPTPLKRMPTLPVLNPDGVSIKNCSYIYAPKGQALEYSPLSCNPYRGCGHKCAYCYVPAAIRMDRKAFDAGATERRDFIRHLQREAAKYEVLGITEQVMLSFTTDVYHPGDTSLTREVIKILQGAGLGVCVLTKGGTRALRDLDLFDPKKDAFASTITSLDAKFSKKWERGAALPDDRLAALQEFHAAGIFTWVSLEPTLDTTASESIIRATNGYVDLYKIGRANYLPMTRTTDWESYTHDMIKLCKELDVTHYIKKDLQGYLPANYPNPLRVVQHN